ncbi:MAG: hypothetical protein Alpg2KO_28730 [Alphaproteobacteria bacterium]
MARKSGKTKQTAKQKQALRDKLKALPQDPHLAAEALLSDADVTDDAAALQLIKRALKKRGASQDLVEALIVRLGNMADITMFGREVKDRISNPGQPALTDDDPKGDKRNHYEVSPYPLASVTASAIPIWKHEETGELYILLGQRSLKEGGLSTTMILPGGFVDAKPRVGGEKRHFDRTLKAAAIRELMEEVTLNAPKGKNKVRLIRTASSTTNNSPATMVSTLWLMDFGSGLTPPVPVASDDLGNARWVPVSKVMKLQNMPRQPYTSPKSRFVVQLNGKRHQILDRQGESIEIALRDYREAELARMAQTRDGLMKQARLLERSGKLPKGKLLALPGHSEFGRAAQTHHEKCLAFAGKLQAAMRRQSATLLEEMGHKPKADRRHAIKLPSPF